MTLEELRQFRIRAKSQGYTDQEINSYLSNGDNLQARQKAEQASKPTPLNTQSVAQPKRPLLQRIGSGLDTVFGGGKIGEAIGGVIARHGEQGKRLAAVDPVFAKQGFGGALGSGVSGKQIAGSALKGAVSIGAAALPGAGTALGKVGQGIALGYATDVAAKLENNKINFTPGVGTAVGGFLPILGKALGVGSKKMLGFTSGAGDDVITRAIKNPRAVSAAVKEFARNPEMKQELVERAKSAIQSFLDDRGDEFATRVSKMQAKAPVPKTIASNAFKDSVKKFRGIVDENGVLQFGDTTLTDLDQRNLQKAWGKLRSWKNVTPQGLEDLRQAIGNLMDDYNAVGNSRANVVLGEVKQKLTGEMSALIPGYGQTLEKYGAKTQIARAVLSELSLKNSNAKPSTQLNKVMALFRRDPVTIDKLVKIMGKDQANLFLDDLAGAVLAQWLPDGMTRQITEGLVGAAGLGLMAGGALSPNLIPAAAMASPKLVGKAATAVGRAKQVGLDTAARRFTTIGGGRIAGQGSPE